MTILEFPRGEAQVAIILARVSSREQEEGHSIDAQKHRLNIYCQRHGLHVLRVFEITESSTRGDRKKFMEMIDYAKKWHAIENAKIKAENIKRQKEGLPLLPLYQKTPIAIVADKVDRVQRSFKEYPLLDALIQDNTIELHFNTEGYVIHSKSVSHERLMWSFSVIMAQSYTDSMKDNVKRSQDHMIRNGGYPAMAPLGYLNTRDAAGRSDIILDPDRAPFVRRLFVEYATGLYTLGQLRSKTKEWGLRNKTRKKEWLSKSHLHMILTNSFYYGVAMIKEQPFPHRYTPLIDKVTFDRCQAVLKGWNKKKFHYGAKEFVFRGLISCATRGHTVTTLEKVKTYDNGEVGMWRYLRCWKPEEPEKVMYIREEKILEQIEAAIKSLSIPADTAEKTIEYLRKTNYIERDFRERQITELNAEAKRIRAKISALMELLLEKAISEADYQFKRNLLQERLNEITVHVQAHTKADDSFKDALIFLVNLCRSPENIFKGSTVGKKREFIGIVFENLKLQGETLCFSYRKPFSYLTEAVKTGKWSELVDDLRNSAIMQQDIVICAEQLNSLKIFANQIDEKTKS